MLERVIADFVSSCGDRSQRLKVFFALSILPDNKDRHLEALFVQRLQKSRNNEIQIGRLLIPTCVAMSLHVRPFVVEIE